MGNVEGRWEGRLEERLMEDYKAALRAGDATRKETLRLMRAAIKAAQGEKRDRLVEKGALTEISAGAKMTEEEALAELERRSQLTEDEVVAALKRQVKQHRDSIEQFTLGKRPDLVQQEQAELDIIEAYLPQQLGRPEIEAIARAAIAELGVSGPSALGQVMRQLMPRFQGRADGKLVNEVVRGLLSQK